MCSSDLYWGAASYRTAVCKGPDVRVVVVGHLLVVGAHETQCLAVTVAGGVVPSDGLVAVIGEVLPCGGSQ